jgi:hypothetical protein
MEEERLLQKLRGPVGDLPSTPLALGLPEGDATWVSRDCHANVTIQGAAITDIFKYQKAISSPSRVTNLFIRS